MMLLEQMFLNGQLCDFIDGFTRIRNDEINEKTQWEFYLHRVFDKSFSDFVSENEFANMPETAGNLEETFNHSFDMLENFIPE